MSFDPISLIGGVLSAVGSIMSGMAQAAAARTQAEIARLNREVALENADRAINRSQVEAYDQDMMTLAMLAEQESVQNASGLTGRSFSLARKTARELGRKDALNIRQAGEIESYNHKVEAENQRLNAEMYEQQASYSMLSGFLGAAQSLIGSFKPSGSMSLRSNPSTMRTVPLPRPRPFYATPSLVS